MVQKLFKEIGPAFADRNGGYTRIIKTAEWRIGDAGDIVVIQLVGFGKNQASRTSAKRKPPRPALDNLCHERVFSSRFHGPVRAEDRFAMNFKPRCGGT